MLKAKPIPFGATLTACLLLIGGAAFGQTAKPGCHPDGKPTESEVIFHSSGGTYGEALQKAFFEPFEKECGIKVSHVTGARNYAQLRQFVRTGNIPWDIGGTMADAEFPLGRKDGLFHKLPANFWDSIKDQMVPGSMSDYGAWATPYSDVLVYSTAQFPGGMKSWADFWDVAKFPGPRIMQNHPISLVMAVLADGVPADKVYPLDIERGFKKLDELRPSIRAFWTSADQPVQGAANGEFAAGTTWSGRVATAMRQGKPVAASWNGALLHEAWNFILKGAAHPRAAEALLYFMQRADRQAELGKLTGYTGGNKNAAALLDPSVAAMLPASPEHVAVAAPVDGAWWAENISQVQARWDAWIAKR